MTALDKYVRLESDALWRAAPDAQRRDVVLSFGDATLVIADGAGRPLAHWSLPALIRQNPGEIPAIYAPDEDGSELLEIADDTMVEAIEKVREALAKSHPRPGKLRLWLTGGLILVTLLLAIFWLPGALTRQTLAVVPQPKRLEIGRAMLGAVQTETGTPCRTVAGRQAADALALRLFGADRPVRIVILPDLAAGAITFPGGLIALDSGILRAADDPAVAAGYVLSSQAAIPEGGPLAKVLQQAGLGTTLRLLTTGDIPADILQDAAQAMLSEPANSNPDALRSLMATAQVPQAPYLAAVDIQTGSMPEIGPDPLAGTVPPLILTDSDWVALQNICNG